MFEDNLINVYRRTGDPAGIEDNNYLSIRGNFTKQKEVKNLNNLLPKGVALSASNIYVPDMVVYNPYLSNATRYSRLPFKNTQPESTYGGIYGQFDDAELLTVGSILNRNFNSKRITTIIKKADEIKDEITDKNMENLGIPLQDKEQTDQYVDQLS